MVATTECLEKSKPIAGNKVSKPLMEKKRRARINKCLDQLKSLLESYYSTSIRKRKLEKADILELTVKHLRSLQKIQSCSSSSDYQSGFRSCLANVNQYLLLADNLNGRMLSQLSSKLSRRRGAEEAFSTTDSGRAGAEPQEEPRRLSPPAAGPEESTGARPKAPKAQNAALSPGRGARQVCVRAQERSCSQDKLHSASHTNGDQNSQHSVWRPW